MNPTDEELLHEYYAGGNSALQELTHRLDPTLATILFLVLCARTGSEIQALAEWDLDERLASVWAHVVMTRQAAMGSWPHQRLSVLTWLIHLLCLEMDRHLGFRAPF